MLIEYIKESGLLTKNLNLTINITHLHIYQKITILLIKYCCKTYNKINNYYKVLS